MKKWHFALIAVWIGILVLAACAAPEPAAPSVEAAPTIQIPNPMVQVPSAAEIGTALGFAFPAPPDGASDVLCFVIANALGHMTFTYDGQPYLLRAAKDFGEDISGLYLEYESMVLEQDIEGDLCSAHLTLRYLKQGGVTVSWQDAGVDYLLYAEEETICPGEATGECDALDLAWRMTQSLYLPKAENPLTPSLPVP